LDKFAKFAKSWRNSGERALGDLRINGAEGQPPLGIQEGQKILPLFRWKDHVVQGIVGDIGVCRTEDGNDPHPSSGATKGEIGHDILAGAPVLEAKELPPSVLPEQIVELLQACGALPFLNH
jgi:hypothetical protein